MPCAKFDVAVFDTGTFCDFARITVTDTMLAGDARVTHLSATIPDTTGLADSGTETTLIFSSVDAVSLSDCSATSLHVTMPDTMLATDELASRLLAAVADALEFDDAAIDHLYENFVLYSSITKELNLWSLVTKEVELFSKTGG